MKESLGDSISTIQENISNTFMEWTEDLKNKLLSEETQDALDTVALLLGEKQYRNEDTL